MKSIHTLLAVSILITLVGVTEGRADTDFCTVLITIEAPSKKQVTNRTIELEKELAKFAGEPIEKKVTSSERVFSSRSAKDKKEMENYKKSPDVQWSTQDSATWAKYPSTHLKFRIKNQADLERAHRSAVQGPGLSPEGLWVTFDTLDKGCLRKKEPEFEEAPAQGQPAN